jgi:hypothetical protein
MFYTNRTFVSHSFYLHTSLLLSAASLFTIPLLSKSSVFMDTKRLLLTAFNNNEQAEEVQKNERAMILCDRKAQHANKQAASKFR